ncbi:MAG: YbhB/YbcL family Raf kinase inhibitor-like protein [Deltaproteobacteria bacterium]|nr:YbhB/YbcL family Raf kinase inhibitor-like protein [Deltaproteobacteria bacterium]
MILNSNAFLDGGTIPQLHAMTTVGGRNVSLPFEWQDPPQGTESFVLTVVDPHAVANNWIHWMVINIPPGVDYLEEGASGSRMPAGCRELKNTFSSVGYGGPQPPPGTGLHPYVCTLFAVSVPALEVPEKITAGDLERFLAGKILSRAVIAGFYKT